MFQEGRRSFRFALNFPHLNLPPTSTKPFVTYSFSAKLAVDDRPASRETLPFSHVTEIMEYRTQPLRICFIPFLDPFDAITLPSPSRPQSQSLLPASASTSGYVSPEFPDRSSPVARTMSLVDDRNQLLASMTAQLAQSRLVPGLEITIHLALQVRNGLPLPRGLGVRVIEARALIREKADGQGTMLVCGKEHMRVLTGKKFLLSRSTSPATDARHNGGERQLQQTLTVPLPSFETYLTDGLLPTSILPLGNPNDDPDMPEAPPPDPPARGNANRKGKSVDTAVVLTSRSRALYLRVRHLVQITAPMTGSHWYQKDMDDLEVVVPIVLGSGCPDNATASPTQSSYYSRHSSAGTGSAAGSFSAGSASAGSSSTGSSSAGSSSVSCASAGTMWGWEPIPTMREVDERPSFVVDG